MAAGTPSAVTLNGHRRAALTFRTIPYPTVVIRLHDQSCARRTASVPEEHGGDASVHVCFSSGLLLERNRMEQPIGQMAMKALIHDDPLLVALHFKRVNPKSGARNDEIHINRSPVPG